MPYQQPTLTQPCDYRTARANARELHAKAVLAADTYRRMCEIASKEPDQTTHAVALSRAQSDAYAKGQCHRIWTLARHYLLGRPYCHAEVLPAPRPDGVVDTLSRQIATVLLEVHDDPKLRIPRNGYPSSQAQAAEHLRLRKALTEWIVQTWVVTRDKVDDPVMTETGATMAGVRVMAHLPETQATPRSALSPGLIFSQPGPFD